MFTSSSYEVKLCAFIPALLCAVIDDNEEEKGIEYNYEVNKATYARQNSQL